MRKNKKYYFLLISSIMLYVIVFISALIIGTYKLTINEIIQALFTSSSDYKIERQILINLRLPRTIVAALTGMALSLSGLLYQETFQNELVSPDLLGVSNGAGVGAALSIILSFSTAITSGLSFIFAVFTVFITITISRLFKNASKTILLLSGIIVSGFMSSILSIIKYLADTDTTLAMITYWLMGSFADSTMNKALILAIIVLTCSSICLIIRNRINIIALGRDEAMAKGVNYNFYKYLIIGLSTLLTASTVAVCGTVSWIGLVIPHIVRISIGTKNTSKTIPLVMTFGANFMMLVDILSRTFTSSEIPLSAITGLLGTVIFILILLFKKKGLKHND